MKNINFSSLGDKMLKLIYDSQKWDEKDYGKLVQQILNRERNKNAKIASLLSQHSRVGETIKNNLEKELESIFEKNQIQDRIQDRQQYYVPLGDIKVSKNYFDIDHCWYSGNYYLAFYLPEQGIIEYMGSDLINMGINTQGECIINVISMVAEKTALDFNKVSHLIFAGTFKHFDVEIEGMNIFGYYPKIHRVSMGQKNRVCV